MTSSTNGAQQDASGFTRQVVATAEQVRLGNFSEAQRARVRHFVLDWLGVTISGSHQPSSRAVQTVCAAEGGNGVAHVIGTGQTATARQAALCGGVASHSQDFDDMGFGSHPAVVILPPVFALAEELGLGGAEAAEAAAWGCEVMDQIHVACGLSSYHRGFHTTGTFGAFGAAMAAGRLLGLDHDQLVMALGIAGTQAAGLKASFGTMCKHLNAGNAASVGVVSARLAQAGYTGAADVLESPQGFVRSHNGVWEEFDPERPRDARLAVEKVMFKFHAACGGTHSAINGIRQIRARRPFTADEVEEIDLLCSVQMPTVCGIPEPVTGVEAMFSIRYAATLALLDRATGPSAFTDEAVKDPELIARRALIKVRTTPDKLTTGAPTDVTVRLKSGEELTASINVLVPATDDELDQQWANLESKFHDLVTPILGAERSHELARMVARFETLESIGALAALCRPA
ncbi:MmgE/PrpD family protein [Novosphingobium bradum]|uniref:MmgE/PrpD family protein n=1 Tax=Novosphingobium bradum TaxID=1737444 RepID=A0ABV7IM19_9SPHN